MENSQYMQVFLDESEENMQVLNTLCLQLEQGTSDDEVFAAMFRAAHTLKGMSATMGFNKMATLTHRLEDVLGVLRQHPTRMTSEILDDLFESLDALKYNLDVLRETGVEDVVDHATVVAKFAMFLSRDASGQVKTGTIVQDPSTTIDFTYDPNILPVLEQCQNSGVVTGVLEVHVDRSCSMKAVRAIVVMREIENLADCLQCQPDATVLEEGTYDEVMYFVVALQNGDSAQLVQAVKNVSEITDVHFHETGANREAATTVEASTSVQSIPEPTKSDSLTKTGTKKNERLEKVDRTIRVSVDRLDSLMNMLSELVIDKTRLSSLATKLDSAELTDVTQHLSRVCNDIQSSVMSLRMVPVESLFQRFPRMVRDLSKSLGKQVRLEMSGLETELDRTVIDEMGEALVHLIRNAVDHGLESTEERIRAGKPVDGTISLRAYASGQSVFIEVADDGGGINTNGVLNKALKNQLITKEQAALLKTEQIYALLFESGFSTAEQISDISGRGVGLDAVKRKVESLGGRIRIESQPGIGTTFRIQLPLTLSILQALLVKISGDIVAVPLGSVEEIVYAHETDLERVHGQTTLNFRGKLLPIVDAGEWLFGTSSLGQMPWKFVICKEGSKRIAVAVDDFLGQQEIVNKSLGEYLKQVQAFSGATILGDGKIALIIDVHAWIEF